jgi:two-component sensor histidine kinase
MSVDHNSTIGDSKITAKLWRRVAPPRDVLAEMQGIRQLRDILANEPGEALAACVRAALRLCSAQSGGVALATADAEGTLHFRATATFLAAPASRLAGVVHRRVAPPPHDYLLTNCVRDGEAVLVSRTVSEASATSLVVQDEVLLLPLGPPGSRSPGVIWVASDGVEHQFDRDDACVLQHIAAFAATALDITLAAKSAHDDLMTQQRASLELAHRVENTLQMTANVLGQQSRILGAGEASAAINGARGRVLAIGSMHRLSSEASADLGQVIQRVCDSITSGDARFAVRVTQSEGVRLSGARAALVVLIANELVTNAVKHAAEGRDRVAIEVSLSVRADDHAEVSFCDDGAPFKELPPTTGRRRGLGLGLVTGLAGQLGGMFRAEPHNKRFVLTFPVVGGPDLARAIP